MYEVTMPKLSDSMELGKIIAWKVAEGDIVAEGDSLAEVESDKAVMELECYEGGKVLRLLHGDGEEVAVGDPIALVGDDGDTTAAKAARVVAPEAVRDPQAASETEVASQAPVEARLRSVAPPHPEKSAPAPSRGGAAPSAGARHGAISPYAGKRAVELDVDITKVTGSGPGGRIIAHDIEAAVQKRETGGITEPAHVELPPSVDEELPAINVTTDEADIEEASFRLKTQVRRVSASKHVIPHFYVTVSVDASALLKRKEDLKRDFGATITHVIMHACVAALKEHPEINRSYDRGRIIRWKHINLGLAVDTEEGLTVAVLRGAEELSFSQLVERTRDLVERARRGKLTADERRHPTFTITNLGMFGVEEFAPIINPPSSITLAVASALPAPVVRKEGIYAGHVMRLTASCDHRIVEGAAAARLMRTVSVLLENPERLTGQESTS